MFHVLTMIHLANYLQYFFICISLSIFIVYGFFNYSFLYWKRKGVPYLKPTILYGNIIPIVRKQVSLGEFGSLMYTEIKKLTGKFGGYYILHHPVFMPIDSELIKNVLVTDFQYFHDRGYHFNEQIDPLNANIVNLRGRRWRKNRARLNTNFTSGKIKCMFNNLLTCIQELKNVLENPSKTHDPIDIKDILGRFTTDNIASFAFDYKYSSLKDPNTSFWQTGKILQENVLNKLNLVGLSFFVPKLYDFLKISLINKRVNTFFMDITKQAIEYREVNKVDHKDFMNLYIQKKNNLFENENNMEKHDEEFTLNELIAMGFAFYIGGYETTANTMTFGLYELSINQNVQNKLREEIFRTIRSYDGEITYEAIMDMTYMDQVINEILRKYPPIPIISRECNQDYKVPGTDVTIDKGVKCWISVLGIHMDPEYYPDPEQFKPERFSEEENTKRLPFTYLPFGCGPRVCIGKRFGLLQIKFGFAELLRRYEFTLDPKTHLPIEFNTKNLFLGTKNKIWLSCTKINN